MNFLDGIFSIGFFLAILRGATPLMLAAQAGLLSERAGIAQIGLEGMMLMGALCAAIGAYIHHSAWLGLIWGIGASILTAWIFAIFVIRLRTDHIITGTALNILVLGLAPLITKAFFDSTGATPSLEIGGRFSFEPIFFALACTFLVWFIYKHTKSGILLQFAGENNQALKAAGYSLNKIRFFALTGCGILCGISGASLSLYLASSYSPAMTAGRGFIALAALILGGWKPIPTLLACLFFAATDVIQMQLQGGDSFIPTQLIQILPYIITIVALSGLLGKVKAPADLAKN